MGLFITFASIATAWFCARFSPWAARVFSLLMPLLGIAILAVLGLTGVLRRPVDAHLWIGHYYVIYFWLAVPIATGFLLQSKLRARPFVACLQCGVLWMGIGLSLLAGFTGYLGPTHNPQPLDETHRRFVLLHSIVLPGLLAGVQVLWLWFVWPVRTSHSEPQSTAR